MNLIIQNICSLSENFSSFMISHVRRVGNTIAHFYARLIPPNGREYVFVSDFPQGIQALAEMETNFH